MNNLKLITTENFEDGVVENGIPCDFWKDVNEEYFITREQIGRALGYSNPQKAIQKIHLKHKDRLDRFSCIIKSEISRSSQNEDSFESRHPQTGGIDSNGSILLSQRSNGNLPLVASACCRQVYGLGVGSY